MAAKMSLEDQKHVRDWMMRNARPLDLTRWKFHFDNGSRGEVIRALAAYQNADGGFGHALEADNWNPASTPYVTAVAADILHEIRFDGRHFPLVDGMLRYLETTPAFTGTRWPAVVPSNNDHPHAPWWSWEVENDAPASDPTDGAWGFTPTAKLCGFILRFADLDSPLFEKALTLAEQAIRIYLEGSTPDGEPYRSVFREGEIAGLNALQQNIDEMRKRATGELLDRVNATFGDLSALKTALAEQAARFIVRDPAKWLEYGCKPSTFVTGRECLFVKGNEDILQTEFDHMLAHRTAEGVWDIVWSWGAYESEFAVSRNWWMGTIALQNMMLLHAFGRLEGGL